LTSRIVRNSVVLVVLAVFGLAVLWTFMSDSAQAEEYPYGQLIADAQAGNVTKITQDGLRVTAEVKGRGEQTAIVPSELTNVYSDLGCAGGDPASSMEP